MDKRPHILMLAGSYSTPELAELSLLYARGAEQALTDSYRFTTLYRDPADGHWSLGDRVDAAVQGEALSEAEARDTVSKQSFAASLPQMFCLPGMTEGRDFLESLDAPMIGNPSAVMAVGADKAATRRAVSAAGVRVPHGTVVAQGDSAFRPDGFPVVVKPTRSDNSDGLSLVRGEAQLAIALARAHQFGDALVEAFIPPGRELRCAVVEWDGRLLALPPEEYPVDPKMRPVRTRDTKLARTAGGKMRLVAKTKAKAWIVEPDDPATPALQEAALAAFRALDCRHYGLFDFRVDEHGTPFFLEAGLYCSFSPDSVVVAMAAAHGIALPDLLSGLIGQARAHAAPTHSRHTKTNAA